MFDRIALHSFHAYGSTLYISTVKIYDGKFETMTLDADGNDCGETVTTATRADALAAHYNTVAAWQVEQLTNSLRGILYGETDIKPADRII